MGISHYDAYSKLIFVLPYKSSTYLSFWVRKQTKLVIFNSILIATPDVGHNQIDKLWLFSEETLATANIITGIASLIVGILLGVLISKKCLQSNTFCNGHHSKNTNWARNNQHNCTFYIPRYISDIKAATSNH